MEHEITLKIDTIEEYPDEDEDSRLMTLDMNLRYYLLQMVTDKDIAGFDLEYNY